MDKRNKCSTLRATQVSASRARQTFPLTFTCAFASIHFTKAASADQLLDDEAHPPCGFVLFRKVLQHFFGEEATRRRGQGKKKATTGRQLIASF